jgi:hypothetical protein
MPLGVRLPIPREAKNVALTGLEGQARADLLAIPASQLICDKSVSARLANRSQPLTSDEIARRSFPKHLSLAFQIHRFLFWIRGMYRNPLFLWQANRLIEAGSRETAGE